MRPHTTTSAGIARTCDAAPAQTDEDTYTSMRTYIYICPHTTRSAHTVLTDQRKRIY